MTRSATNGLPARANGRDTRAPRGWPRRPVLFFEPLEEREVPATLVVNTLLDNFAADGLLSLREAVEAVDLQSSATLDAGAKAQITGTFGTNDAITFTGLNGTINLSLGELFLTQNVTVT